jgi:hypothetical protein
MAGRALSTDRRNALSALADDLRRIFGVRLKALLAYGLQRLDADEESLHTLALVDRVTFDDLAACIPAADGWAQAGLAVPLVISHDEFRRTLDVFPLEYDEIVADHVVIEGADPFAEVRVAEADLRRAIESQAKSHLIHLREGFLESGRNSKAVARLIAASAPAFRTLLRNITRLDGRAVSADDAVADAAEQTIRIDAGLVLEVLNAASAATTAVDPTALLSRYMAAAERVWRYVDGWKK